LRQSDRSSDRSGEHEKHEKQKRRHQETINEHHDSENN
jgi:hypothetical protein